jgi:hypothetical protein
MNKPFVTPARLERVFDIPVSFAQTEVRQNKTIAIATIPVNQGEKLLLQSLSIHLVKILTPGENAILRNTAFGMAHVGLYFGGMLTSPLAYARLLNVGVCTTNLFRRWAVTTPGVYTVVIANNTDNLILSLSATGSVKMIYA